MVVVDNEALPAILLSLDRILISARRSSALPFAIATLALLLSATPARGQGAAAATLDQLLAQGQVDAAVKVLAEDASSTGTLDQPRADKVARAVLSREATNADDDVARAEACLTLSASAPAPCLARLKALAEARGNAALKLRVAFASPNSKPSQAWIDQVTGHLTPQDWASVADAAGSLPPPVAVALIRRALTLHNPDVEFTALSTLARLNDPSALPTLKEWSTHTSSPARFVALAGAAGLGDAAALAAIRADLSDIEGADAVLAGRALARQKDPRGLELLRSAQGGATNDLVRLDAVAALASSGDTLALRQLQEAVGSPNPGMRLRAIELMEQAGLPADSTVVRQMADPSSLIRVRAAQAVLAGDPTTKTQPAKR
jgi:hypothetical protein